MQFTSAKTRARQPLHGRLAAFGDTGPTNRSVAKQDSALSTKYSVLSTVPWRLTRALSTTNRFAILRCAAIDELGPGCYVIKSATSRESAQDIANAMLRREALVANTVSHPNIVSVLCSDFQSTPPYIILPYFEGITLRRLITSTSAPLTVIHALGLIRQMAESLAALHRAGWLHGQVRPDHVLVAPQGQATLIDLTQAGRLETAECESSFITSLAAQYAAPESFVPSRRLSAAADIYALGVTLFELLTGRLPFLASSPQELARCHRSEIPPALQQFRPDALPEVGELCRRMLAKEPLRRPDATQVVRWLAELEIAELSGAGILACH